MGKFAKVSQSAFNELQLDAGVLLKNFDPKKPELIDENIICATTGGINPTCTPTFTDMAEDIDNVPNNMLEFKQIQSWECGLGFTALSITAETIKMSLGAADITEGGKITPRNSLKREDFQGVWWVGDLSDGGFAAIHLKNALSTGGFSLQTTKNGKGQIAVTLTGHYSTTNQDEVPMDFYVVKGTDVPGVAETANTSE